MLIYQIEDGLTKIDVNMQNETVWLSQTGMTKLFQTTKQNISLHINNIFKDGEFEKELRAMGQLVSGYLDFAERQAEREIPMTIED
jgi:hypothetical protein